MDTVDTVLLSEVDTVDTLKFILGGKVDTVYRIQYKLTKYRHFQHVATVDTVQNRYFIQIWIR